MSATFSGEEILYAATGRVVRGRVGSEAGRITWNIDDIREGDWFVAMPSQSEDTHDRISAALNRGARGCIVNNRSRYSLSAGAGTLIAVANTKVAILELVRYWRHAVSPQVIAVVGEAGRKTIINILELILTDAYRCHKAFEGNSWSCVSGVLAMPKNTEVLIAEVTGSKRGDIARIGSCLTPDLAIIGKTEHSLRSNEENTKTAALYCEILDTVQDYDGGCAVVYDQNPAVHERAKQMLCGLRSVLFSQTPEIPDCLDSLGLADRIDINDGKKTDANVWCAAVGAQALGLSQQKKAKSMNTA